MNEVQMTLEYVMTQSSGLTKRIVVCTWCTWCNRTHEFIPIRLPEQVRKQFSKHWKLLSIIPVKAKGKGGAAARATIKSGKAKANKPNVATKMSPKEFSPGKADWVGDAQKFAEILQDIISGLSSKKCQKNKYNIDPIGLALSYKKGDNPIDFLSKPVEQERKPAILITPDYSGSTAGFSAFTKSISALLAQKFDMYYVSNHNGQIRQPLPEVDLILYMGDRDVFGPDLGELHVMTIHKPCIVLDNTECNKKSCFVNKKLTSKSVVCISAVSLKSAKSYVLAIELARKAIKSKGKTAFF